MVQRTENFMAFRFIPQSHQHIKKSSISDAKQTIDRSKESKKHIQTLSNINPKLIETH